MTVFADLFTLTERERIRVIGIAAAAGNVVNFIVDGDIGVNETKADRYLKALLDGYAVRHIDTSTGPVEHSIQVRIGPKES